MLKGLLLGAVVGTLAAAGAYRAFAWRRGAEAPAPAATNAAGGPRVPVADPELEALKAENERLRAELASLEKAEAAKTASPKTAPKSALSWKELGAKLYKLRDQLKNHDETSPEMTELWTDFMALLTEAAKQDGVTFEEAMMGPNGMLAMLQGVLAGSDLPPDAAQQAKIDAASAAAAKDWKDYLATRDAKSAMERNRDLLSLSGSGLASIKGVLTPAQMDMLEKLEMFDDNPSMRSRTNFSGDRATVTTQLADAWKSELKLDETQRISIGPIVDEYMRGYDEITADAERRKAAGEKVNGWTTAQKEADLMVATQKRMKETLRLTEAQEKAMKDWSGSYGYEVTGAK